MSSDDGSGTVDFNSLPEDCIAKIVSLTSPRDACRLSLVSSLFKRAAESDAVWEKSLPPDYHSIIAESVESPPLRASKKELFLALSETPLLIDNGKKSFSLEKATGKKCFMLSARDLVIVWGDTPKYWKWVVHPNARFSEVAQLVIVCWLEIHGGINTSILSKNTHYGAYLVFSKSPEWNGFKQQEVEVSVAFGGAQVSKRIVYLDVDKRRRVRSPKPLPRQGRFSPLLSGQETALPRMNDDQYPKERDDGWLEVQLGEFYNDGEGKDLKVSVLEVKTGIGKVGLIVQGIEIKPKEGK